jgi:hypothetical protein
MEANESLIDREGRLSTADSPLRALVIPVEEGCRSRTNAGRLFDSD